MSCRYWRYPTVIPDVGRLLIVAHYCMFAIRKVIICKPNSSMLATRRFTPTQSCLVPPWLGASPAEQVLLREIRVTVLLGPDLMGNYEWARDPLLVHNFLFLC